MRLLTTCLLLVSAVVLLRSEASAQASLCDFASNLPNFGPPTNTWTQKDGSTITNWTHSSPAEYKIYSSTIGTGSVLELWAGSASSPRWVASPALTYGFNYDLMQWTFWWGRKTESFNIFGFIPVTALGSQDDISKVWLFVNRKTDLTNPTTPTVLEGVRIDWYKASSSYFNEEWRVKLVKVNGATETVITDFQFLTDDDNNWGATMKIIRRPTGTPLGSEAQWEVWSSTPAGSTSSSHFVAPNADPDGASQYQRALVTESPAWIPNATSGYMCVQTDFTSRWSDGGSHYNQLCYLNSGPLPVELTSFSADYRNDVVNLNWRTATEMNNYGFEVQRSVEHNGTWETIGFVDGNGTTNSPRDYRYTDAPNADGASMIAYRLKQIDRDGSYEFSNTILVSIAPKSTDVLYNFPNPFNPTTNITFTLLQDDVVTLNVFNSAGEKVAEIYDAAPMSAGYHTASFNGTELPSGRYFYRLTTSAGTKTNSMVLSK